ncbi:MAG: protein translocase subunit SecD [Deltaproteobacteria bacterium]|jgi:preprotein translocase subunit SecD|nr:protein translocase subunit SecD [Deltaproteobacteria bacterium]
MKQNLLWRGIILAAVLILGTIYVLPTLLLDSEGKTPRFLPDKVINQGLDLKGGIYLVMEVDLNAALKNNARRLADDLRRRISDEKIPGVSVDNEDSLDIQVGIHDPLSAKPLDKLLEDRFYTLRVKDRQEGSLTLTLTDEEADSVRTLTARQALETIRNRVDSFGVSEPDIRPQGRDRIVIQLPGFDDPKRAAELIGKTAVLEFKLVDEGAVTAEEALANGAPPGTEVYMERSQNPYTGETVETPILLQKRTLMTGETITDARAFRGDFGDPRVSIRFDSRGAREFADITGQYTKRRLAIVLDGVVYSAPTINDHITGGECYIERRGNFSLDEANMLAVILRAGALPAPVTILEERTVGPSLGQDSIRQGLTAGVIGLSFILVFIVFYYRWSGVVADLALLMNFPIILGILAGLGATLTLPGIFGLVLTFAMAVDANVLIFERIREELRQGRGPVAAVNGGFDRAFWTIFDANLTTILAAMVLYQFGSGPVRGFAVTLIIGIVSSMFTAIFGSRLIFDLALKYRRVERISI